MRKKEKCNFKLGEKLDKIILYSERDDIVISNDIKVGPNKSEKIIPRFFVSWTLVQSNIMNSS